MRYVIILLAITTYSFIGSRVFASSKSEKNYCWEIVPGIHSNKFTKVSEKIGGHRGYLNLYDGNLVEFFKLRILSVKPLKEKVVATYDNTNANVKLRLVSEDGSGRVYEVSVAIENSLNFQYFICDFPNSRI